METPRKFITTKLSTNKTIIYLIAMQTYKELIIAKLFEKLVCNQLKTYMMNNNIITKNQSGFREHHSTETALLDLTNDWLHNMDNGLLNGVLSLDFKRRLITQSIITYYSPEVLV